MLVSRTMPYLLWIALALYSQFFPVLTSGGSWKGWLNFAARLGWNFLLALVVFAYPLSRRASLIRRESA